MVVVELAGLVVVEVVEAVVVVDGPGFLVTPIGNISNSFEIVVELQGDPFESVTFAAAHVQSL